MKKSLLLKQITSCAAITAVILGGCIERMPSRPTLNDTGSVGLLRLPSARNMGDSVTAFTFSETSLDRSAILTAQILPRLELAIRQSQSLQDGWATDLSPGLDGKLTVIKEGKWLPETAVGIRSFSGASRHSSEYIVASKKFWNMDFSVGLGWGAIAGHDRSPTDLDGESSVRNWFTGPPSLFGGVQVHTPIEGLSLVTEYDPDRRKLEKLADPNVKSRWPINLGVVYRPLSWLEGSLGWEQGERAMFRLSAYLDAKSIRDGKAFPGWPTTVIPKAGMMRQESIADSVMVGELRKAGVPAFAARIEELRATVWLEDGSDGSAATIVGRAARVMANKSPASVQELVVVLPAGAFRGTAVSILRDDIRKAARSEGSPAEVWLHAKIYPAESPPSGPLFLNKHLDWRIAAHIEQSPFEGYGLFLERIFIDTAMDYHLFGGLMLSGATRYMFSSNLDQIYWIREPSENPVRSDLPDYSVPGSNTLEHLYASWSATPWTNLHTRATVGFLEEMFGGVAGEVLYKPQHSRWSVGADAAYIWKREPFGYGLLIRDTGRLTGFASLYYKYDPSFIEGRLSLGRYLGGDYGSTLDIKRKLGNGVDLSAYATWSIGGHSDDGRLDFGLGLSIPLGERRLIKNRYTIDARMLPLARDNGQRLQMQDTIMDIVGPTDYGTITRDWENLMR